MYIRMLTICVIIISLTQCTVEDDPVESTKQFCSCLVERNVSEEYMVAYTECASIQVLSNRSFRVLTAQTYHRGYLDSLPIEEQNKFKNFRNKWGQISQKASNCEGLLITPKKKSSISKIDLGEKNFDVKSEAIEYKNCLKKRQSKVDFVGACVQCDAEFVLKSKVFKHFYIKEYEHSAASKYYNIQYKKDGKYLDSVSKAFWRTVFPDTNIFESKKYSYLFSPKVIPQ